MKSKKLIYLIIFSIIIYSCDEQNKSEEDVIISNDGTFKSIYTAKSIGDLQIKMSNEEIENYSRNLKIVDSIGGVLPKYEKWLEKNNSIDDKLNGHLKSDDFFKNNIDDAIKFFAKNDCWNDRPKTIRDLTDGVLIDAYSFEKGDEKKLGLLGFFNIELSDNQKVVVVEYSQEGTHFCNNSQNKYGIGARLMMKVTKSKRNAKLNTPQQITASVIFGRAEVTYSLKTFGITGPGIGKLNKTGSLSEDTYQAFIQEISNLIVEMYKKESSFIVVPQPLPLKNI